MGVVSHLLLRCLAAAVNGVFLLLLFLALLFLLYPKWEKRCRVVFADMCHINMRFEFMSLLIMRFILNNFEWKNSKVLVFPVARIACVRWSHFSISVSPKDLFFISIVIKGLEIVAELNREVVDSSYDDCNKDSNVSNDFQSSKSHSTNQFSFLHMLASYLPTISLEIMDLHSEIIFPLSNTEDDARCIHFSMKAFHLHLKDIGAMLGDIRGESLLIASTELHHKPMVVSAVNSGCNLFSISHVHLRSTKERENPQHFCFEMGSLEILADPWCGLFDTDINYHILLQLLRYFFPPAFLSKSCAEIMLCPLEEFLIQYFERLQCCVAEEEPLSMFTTDEVFLLLASISSEVEISFRFREIAMTTRCIASFFQTSDWTSRPFPPESYDKGNDIEKDIILGARNLELSCTIEAQQCRCRGKLLCDDIVTLNFSNTERARNSSRDEIEIVKNCPIIEASALFEGNSSSIFQVSRQLQLMKMVNEDGFYDCVTSTDEILDNIIEESKMGVLEVDIDMGNISLYFPLLLVLSSMNVWCRVQGILVSALTRSQHLNWFLPYVRSPSDFNFLIAPKICVSFEKVEMALIFPGVALSEVGQEHNEGCQHSISDPLNGHSAVGLEVANLTITWSQCNRSKTVCHSLCCDIFMYGYSHAVSLPLLRNNTIDEEELLSQRIFCFESCCIQHISNPPTGVPESFPQQNDDVMMQLIHSNGHSLNEETWKNKLLQLLRKSTHSFRKIISKYSCTFKGVYIDLTSEQLCLIAVLQGIVVKSLPCSKNDTLFLTKLYHKKGVPEWCFFTLELQHFHIIISNSYDNSICKLDKLDDFDDSLDGVSFVEIATDNVMCSTLIVGDLIQNTEVTITSSPQDTAFGKGTRYHTLPLMRYHTFVKCGDGEKMPEGSSSFCLKKVSAPLFQARFASNDDPHSLGRALEIPAVADVKEKANFQFLSYTRVPSSFQCIPYEVIATSSNSGFGMLFSSTAFNLTIEEVESSMGNLSMRFFSDLSLALSQASLVVNKYWEKHYISLRRLVAITQMQSLKPVKVSGYNIPMTLPCDSVALVNCQISRVKIQLTYNQKDAFLMLMKSMRLHAAEYPIQKVSQLNGKIQDVNVSDLTERNSWFKSILCSTQEDDEIMDHCADGGITEDVLAFHHTSSTNLYFHPLFEIYINNLRLTYLHRAVMTLVSYFFDHIMGQFDRVSAELDKGTLASNSIGLRCHELLCLQNGRNDSESDSDDYECNVSADNYSNCGGMYRLCATLHNSEVHVPINSCGDDALVLLPASVRIYRSDAKFEGENTLYCQGPLMNYLSCINFEERCEFRCQAWEANWVSDYRYHENLCHDVIDQDYYLSNIPLCSSSEKMAALLPPGTYPSEHRQGLTVRDDIQVVMLLSDMKISTWCCNHSIAENMEISVKYNKQTVSPSPEGMYAPVGDVLDFRQAVPLGMHLVDLSIPKLDWCLSRGQYSCLVMALQQNLGELQKVIPEGDCASPVKVALGHQFFDKNVVENRIPLSLALNVYIPHARLHLLENTSDYYSRLFYSHECISKFRRRLLSEKVEDILIIEKEDFIREWFKDLSEINLDHRRRCSGFPNFLLSKGGQQCNNVRVNHAEEFETRSRSKATVGCEEAEAIMEVAFANGTVLDGFSIPPWSQHFELRDLKYRGKNRCKNDYQQLDSIGFLYFTDLDVSFLQRHHGAATVLDVTAHELFLTAGSNRQIYQSELHLNEASYTATQKRYAQWTSAAEEEQDICVVDPVFVFDELERIPPEFILLKQVSHDEESISEYSYAFHYKQSSVKNLRQCIANFSSCVLVAHLPLMYDLQSFFQEVTYLTYIRELECMRWQQHDCSKKSMTADVECVFEMDGMKSQSSPPAVLNFNAPLDVEVTFCDSLLAFPEYAYTPNSSMLCPADTKALCLNLTSLSFTFANRGYLEAGPGWSTTSYKLDVTSTFISNVSDLNCGHSSMSRLFESITAPLMVRFDCNYSVLPPYHVAQSHFSSLHECFKIPLPSHRYEANRDGLASSDNMMLLLIQPLEASLAEKSSRENPPNFLFNKENSDAESECDELRTKQIVVKMSLPDISFLISVCGALSTSSSSYIVRPLVRDIYSPLFCSFNDIWHLSRYTAYSEHVEICGSGGKDIEKTGYYEPTVKTTEVILKMSSLKFFLRNNTYGLKIAKLHLIDPNLSFNRMHGVINVAGRAELLIYLFNSRMGEYETMVEQLHVTCVCASDVTNVLSEAAMKSLDTSREVPELMRADSSSSEATQLHISNMISPKLRLDVDFEPVEVNICDGMIVSVISKLALGDVITSSSANAPVYRALNKLGVKLNCTFLFENYDYEYKCVELLDCDEVIAIDTRQKFSQYCRVGAHGSSNRDEDEDESHVVSLAFTMGHRRYRSRNPVPIDKEGTYSVIMKVDDFVFSAGSTSVNASSVHIFDQRQNTSDVVVLMEMKIVDVDGTREIVFHSALSIKNETDLMVRFRLDLLATTATKQLSPGDEWFVPVNMISQYTSVRCTLSHSNHASPSVEVDGYDGSASSTLSQMNTLRESFVDGESETNAHCPSFDWITVYKSMYDFIAASGNAWSTAAASKQAANDFSNAQFKASMVVASCPWRNPCIGTWNAEVDEMRGETDKNKNKGKQRTNMWCALMRPFPLSTRIVQQGQTSETAILPPRKSPNIKFPAPGDSIKSSGQQENIAEASKDQETFRGDFNKSNAFDSHSISKSNFSPMTFNMFPSRLTLMAPVRILNQFCQPIHFRMREGKFCESNCGEGTILPGHAVDMYVNPTNMLQLSIRLLNYKWSSWMKLMTFSPSPREIVEHLSSLRLFYRLKEEKMRVPSVAFTVKMHENNIMLCCSMWLINRAGVNLHYKEGGLLSSTNDYKSIPTFLPHNGTQRIENEMVKIKESSEDEIYESTDHRDFSKRSHATRHCRRNSWNMNVDRVAPDFDDNAIAISKPFSNTSPPSHRLPRRQLIRRSVSEKVLSMTANERDYCDVRNDEIKDIVVNSIPHNNAPRKSIGGEISVLNVSQQRTLFAAASMATIADVLDFTVYSPFNRLQSFPIRMNINDTVERCREKLLHVLFRFVDRTYGATPHIPQSTDLFGSSNPDTSHGGGYDADDFFLFDMGVVSNDDKSDSQGLTANEKKSYSQPQDMSPDPRRRKSLFSFVRSGKSENKRDAADKGPADTTSTFITKKKLIPASGQSNEEGETKASAAYGMNILPYVMKGRESALKLDSLMGTISNPRALLCLHTSELRLLEQVLVSETDESGSKSAVTKMLNRNSDRIYPFFPFRGEIPFNPAGMLGIFPSFSVCIPHETEWSEAINVHKLDFSVAGAKMLYLQGGFSDKVKDKQDRDVIRESRLMACGMVGTGLHHPCELAVLVQHGVGLYKGVSAVTFVPRIILSSKLPFAIELRQVRLNDDGKVGESSKSFVLLPGSVQQYHHPLGVMKSSTSSSFSHQTSLVQICQVSPMKSEENTLLSYAWSGEFDMTIIGVTNVKLVDPNKILHIRGETAGGTHVVNFSLQHTNWPPYRIDNRTSFEVRVKQRRISKNSKGSFDLCQYEKLAPFSTLPYAWDYCLNYSTEKRVLTIEFKQGKEWSAVDFPLDEVGREVDLSLQHDLPDLSRPMHEGVLECKHKYERNTGQDWKKWFCLVHNDVFYMFKNDTKADVFGLINLFMSRGKVPSATLYYLADDSGMPQSSDTIEQSKFRTSALIIELSVEFATVEREVRSHRGLANILTQTLGFKSSRAPIEVIAEYYENLRYFDINSMRRRMLILAEYLGLLRDAATTLRVPDSDDDSLAESDEAKGDESNRNGDLFQALKVDIRVRELINYLTGKTIHLIELSNALVEVGDAPTAHHAKYLLQQMLLRGYLERMEKSVASSDVNKDDIPEPSSLPSHIDLRVSRLRSSTTHIPISEPSHPEDIAVNQWEANFNEDMHELVKICPPSLSHELEKLSNEINFIQKHSKEGTFDSQYSYSIKIGKSIHRFRCQTEESMWTWMIGVRTCIESAWVRLLLKGMGNKNGNSRASEATDDLVLDYLTKESLDTGVKVNVRTEGPMKVVDLDEEVLTIAESATTTVHQSKKDKFSSSNSATRQNSNLTVTSANLDSSSHSNTNTNISSLLHAVERESNDLHCSETQSGGRVYQDSTSASQTSETSSMQYPLSSSIKQENVTKNRFDESELDSPAESELYVNIYFPSIGLSIIETSAQEPAELLYVSFRDAQLSYEQSTTSNCVTYAFTVRHIQIDNQLLNPLYPVSFRPRSKFKLDADTPLDSSQKGQGPSSSKFLMLPGLPTQYYQSQSSSVIDSARDLDPSFRYPTIHCFCRQRASVGRSTTTYEEIVAEEGGDISYQSDLLYFELLTMWVAPLELSIDEETFVRLLHFCHIISVTHRAKASNIGIHLGSDDMVTSAFGPEHSLQIYADQREQYSDLLLSGVQHYESYYAKNAVGKNIYFGLLQMHPVDLVLSIRDTPDFIAAESGVPDVDFLTKAVRVDYGQIKLNALMVKDVFGQSSFIVDILSKHYTSAVIRQVMPLVGSTDMFEGSVGLLTNLGTGVYDLFYEPIEGLLGDEQTFMEGLTRGGKSLAAKTIGGTSGFTSKVAGGLGKGMSLLTMDKKFQQRRNRDRLKTAQSVKEGLTVGSKEFGRNVIDGFTGIVLEPYRGWKEDGSIGLGKGLAKGLLGAAIKPAVGVLDLTSRTAEGVRNAAFNTKLEAGHMNILGRLRLPRQFSRDGLVVPYCFRDAMIQLIVDRLTLPTRKRRCNVYHNYCFPRSRPRENKRNPSSGNSKKRKKSILRQGNMIVDIIESFDTNVEVERSIVSMKSDGVIAQEISGYTVGDDYFVTISLDKILLFCVNMHMHGSSCKSNNARNSHGVLPGQSQHSRRDVLNVKLVWSCPIQSVGEFASDMNGDLLLSIATDCPAVRFTGPWHTSTQPIVHDPVLIDYYHFQEYLEGSVGAGIAQQHPLNPDVDENDCLSVDIYRKRTGLQSIVSGYSCHQYRIFKFVLYEFTDIQGNNNTDDKTGKDVDRRIDAISQLGDASDIHSENSPSILYDEESSVGQFLRATFSKHMKRKNGGPQDNNDYEECEHDHCNTEFANRSRNMLLTMAVPLINIRVLGPDAEDNKRFSIHICHKIASSKLNVLMRNEPCITSRLNVQPRDTLTLVFPDRETAQVWKVYLAETAANIGTRGMEDILHPAGYIAPVLPKVRRSLVIPVGGTDLHEAEKLKIEIAKNLSMKRS